MTSLESSKSLESNALAEKEGRSAACLCEWRGDLRAGTHADCLIHGRMVRDVQRSALDALEAENQQLRDEVQRLNKVIAYGVTR